MAIWVSIEPYRSDELIYGLVNHYNWKKWSKKCKKLKCQFCHTRPNLESNLVWILQVLTCKLGHGVAWLCEGTTHPPGAIIWKQYRTCSQVVWMLGQCYRHNLTQLIKIFQDPKYFGTQNFMGSKSFWGPTIFAPKILETQNFSWPNISRDKKFSGT